MHIIFWTILIIIFYTYVGYPLLVFLLSLIINKKVDKKDIEPSVTLLITAYNEEKSIRKKIENTLTLDYPADKLEIMVASDGSTDRTDEIVEEFRDKGVVLHRVEGRVGKTETQNQAVKVAKGEIIIFSDATTDYDKLAIRKTVRNYNDPKVGAVSGRYEYVDPKGTPIGLSTILFWGYENFVKSRQTKLKTITGCCGCIYSVRKELYEPLRSYVISDLVEPLKILEKGYRIVFESEAVAYEVTTESVSEEFNMRVRVITRGMNGLLAMKSLFNPFKHGLFIFFQLFSHKLLRWSVPLLLITLFVTNIFLLNHWFYKLTLALQSVLYVTALFSYVMDIFKIKSKVFSLPLYFCVVNFASLISMVKVISGQKETTWEPLRE